MNALALKEGFLRGFRAYERFIKKFMYSDLYIALVCLVVFVAWVTRCAPFGFIALILLSAAVLIAADDVLPMCVNIFAAVLMIYDDKVDTFLYLWPTFIPLGLAIAVFVLRNFKHKFKPGKMFLPQLAVCLALLVGGANVTTSEEYIRALPTALFLGFGVLAVYLLFGHFLKRDGKADATRFFAKTMLFIGLVVCVELIVSIARANVPVSGWNRAYWDVGWGNRNNIATYLLFTAPMCFYLSVREKHGWAYMAIGIVQYLCIVLTFSRGGVLFGFISAVAALVCSFIKTKNRKRWLICVAAALGVLLIAYFAAFDKVNAVVKGLFERGVGLSGRDELYFEAWDLFKSHPALGVGLGYVGSGPCPVNDMQMYWFHSTLFQVIASTGVVGALLYAFNYGARLKILFGGIRNKFNLFVLVAFIGFEGYSMIDTGTMVPFPNMMLVLLMTLLMERALPDKSVAEVSASAQSADCGVSETLPCVDVAFGEEAQSGEEAQKNVEAQSGEEEKSGLTEKNGVEISTAASVSAQIPTADDQSDAVSQISEEEQSGKKSPTA